MSVFILNPNKEDIIILNLLNKYNNVYLKNNESSLFKITSLNKKIKKTKITEKLLSNDDNSVLIFVNLSKKDYKLVKIFKNVIIFIPPDEILNLIDLFIQVSVLDKEDKLPQTNEQFYKKYLKSNIFKTAFLGYMLPSSIVIAKLISFVLFIKYFIILINTQMEVQKKTKEVPDFFKPIARHLLNIKNFIVPSEMLDSYKKFDDFTKNVLNLQLILAGIITLVILSYFIPKNNKNIKKLDFKKIKKDISPFIKIYDLTPNYIYIEKKTPYTKYQTSKFLKLTYSKLKIDSLNVEIINPSEYIKKLSSKEFLENGVKISNFVGENDFYPFKFNEIVKLASEKNQKTVVYSTYPSSFIKFLNDNNIGFIAVNNYKDSFNQIHLLEPFINFNDKIKILQHIKKQQKERKITVYQWYCSLQNISSKLHAGFASFINKFKYKPEILSDFSSDFAQDVTPDEIIINNEKIAQKMLAKLKI